MTKLKIHLVVVSMMIAACTFGCEHSTSSPLDTDGVERVTPYGREWAANDISWSPDGTKLAVGWSRMNASGLSEGTSEGYVYVMDLVTRIPRILTDTKTSDGVVVDVAWSPASDQIAYFTSGGNGQWPGGIWMVQEDGIGAPIFLGEGVECTWSPDGNRIAVANYYQSNYTISIMDVPSRELYDVVQIPFENKRLMMQGIAWSPDGKTIAFSLGLYDQIPTSDSFSIWILDVASGSYQILYQGKWAGFPSWSPDSEMLAFTGGDSSSKRTLMIISIKEKVTVMPLNVTGISVIEWSPDGSKIAFEWNGGVYTLDVATVLDSQGGLRYNP